MKKKNAEARSQPTQKARAKVGVIMGSQSDLKVMEQALKVLHDFDVPHEVRVVSAHRTPGEMFDYAMTAEDRGLQIIIAGAGGAAHLPGMVAAACTLPVIGVPVNVTSLEGLDALLSVVQMPRGVPVATVAIDNATNAGLLAVRILAVADPALRTKLHAYREHQAEKVTAANLKLKVKVQPARRRRTVG